MSYNKVILLGRLTADPQLKQTPSGKKVTSFCIAVDSKRKDDSGMYISDFFNIVAWEKTAEFITKYFGKGKEIFIDGCLQSRSWEKNGEKRYTLEVLVESVRFVGSKTTTQPADSGPYTSDPLSTNDARAELEEASDEDLPF